MSHFVKMVVISLVGLGLVACGGVEEFKIEPTSLRIVAQDDQGQVFDKGDEPYIGIIHFKAFFGSVPSVSVSTNTNFDTLDTNARAGDVINIAPDFPIHSFGTLSISTKESLENGAGLFIAGAIYVGMDHDWAGKSVVRDRLDEIADDLEASLITNIGGGSFGALGLGIWSALDAVMADLDMGEDSSRSGIGDDMVGTGVALYLGMEESYYDELEDLIWGAIVGWEDIDCGNGPVSICPMKSEIRILHLNNNNDSNGDYRVTLDVDF